MTTLDALAGRTWDVLVVGGGVTGAGIAREAAGLGLRAALVEQNDFASGTSSRSSKLVHGGLRYLNQGNVRLMRESIHERARLLRDGPGLVEYVGYLHAIYRQDRPGALVFDLALRLYALLGGHRRQHQRLAPGSVVFWAPGLDDHGLTALFEFGESLTDDSRLVLRILRDAANRGAVMLNYARVESLLRNDAGRVVGATVADRESGRRAEVRARAVVNATGAWADELRGQVQARPMLRPMRGSHLVIPGWRLRLGQVISFFHPENGRPLFCVPWQGVVLVGTTDVDQHEALDADPRPSPDEIQFLLSGLQARFPQHEFTGDDLQAVFAGVRPVADIRTGDPAKASREHAIRMDAGLLTVTGGKLTTFRLMARDALEALRSHLGGLPPRRAESRALDPLPPLPGDLPLPAALARRWLAHYGPASLGCLLASTAEARRPLAGAAGRGLADLQWMARAEAVRHLDDLMLRRSRLGLTAPRGGLDLLPRLRPVVQAELGWADDRWQSEVARYRALWQRVYSPVVG